jgi:hypothetical protein
MLKRILRKFYEGLSTYGLIKPVLDKTYPFGFPDKGLSMDWGKVGEDINNCIEKLDKRNERK